MSAAEKLRALETTLKTDDTEEWEGAMIDLAEAMTDALPEIIAVVEAAERQKHGSNCASWRQRRDAANVIRSACDCKLGAALAALDAALTVDGETPKERKP